MDINQTFFDCIETNISNSKTDNNIEEVDILDDCSTYIGFGSESGAISIKVLSIIGFVLNFIFLIFQHLKIKRKKKKNRRKNSMRRLFQILPLFDCITSVYWIISSFYFTQARDIKNNPQFCSGLSTFYLVCFTFQFVMINFILIHFRKINMNPMEGILKPSMNLLIYIIVSLVTGVIFGFVGIFFNLIGRSPMNTCFINTEKNDKNGLFFLIPILFIFIAIIQIIIDLCCREMFITDKGIRKIHKKNSTYVFIFCILHIPMIILFLHTIIQEQGGVEIPDEIFKVYAFCISIFTCMIPLIIGLIRYFQGLTKIECISDILRNSRVSKIKKTATLNSNNRKKSSINSNVNCSMDGDPYEWLESHAMEYFMRDIFLGIACGLNSSKQYGDIISIEEVGDSMEIEKYVINKKNFESYNINDDSVVESDYLCVKVINYAPKSFAYLRQMEHINIDEMVESFLPKNNTHGLKKSQGKSGSFFISTDDNKYMIKSLKSDEIDLIRNGFLKKYIHHIEETNNQSLLCRLYGMFNIILAQGDEILLIVMRNVIGDLKDNTVIKFDLKGSTYKRKADLETTDLNNGVMKDLNFNEIEKNIMISQGSINKLRNIISSDSKFLSKSELMDYSLFLVKITLNKEEAADIFGENINKNQDKALKQLLMSQTSKETNIKNNQNNIDNDIENNNDNDDNDDDKNDNGNNILKIDELKEVASYGSGNIHDIKHYKQYLYPSLNHGVGYIISIIDYFQYFNFYKVIEAGIISKFKTGLSKANNNTISCVDPKTYSERFIKYVNQLTDVSQILDGTEVPIREASEENLEDREQKLRYNSDDREKFNLYNNNEDYDKFNTSDEVRITINDPKVKFNLRITVMNRNLFTNNIKFRKTNTHLVNNFKFNE